MTTFFIPLFIIKSQQGGVRPWCEHGSRLTYKVRFFECFFFSPFIAATSACISPAFICHPSLIILLFSIITAPTNGFGYVIPVPFFANFIHLFMKVLLLFAIIYIKILDYNSNLLIDI